MQLIFSEEKYNNTFRMQNIKQLKFSVDSLKKKFAQQYKNFSESFYKRTGYIVFKQVIRVQVILIKLISMTTTLY